MPLGFSRINGISYFAGVEDAAFTIGGIDLSAQDGTDQLQIASNGFTDTKTLTFACWFYAETYDSTNNQGRLVSVGDSRYSNEGLMIYMYRNSGSGDADRISIRGRRSNNNWCYRVDSSSLTFAADKWHHILFSVDLSTVTSATAITDVHVFINGSDVTSEFSIADASNNNANISGQLVVGSATDDPYTVGGNFDTWHGSLAEWFFDDSYIDLTDYDNVVKFIGTDGLPQDGGSDGSNFTGSQPLCYFSGDTSTFATNKGSASDLDTTDVSAQWADWVSPNEISGRPWEIEFQDNAQLDTAQAKFGDTSLDLDGSDDHARLYAPIDFSNPWTIECWFYTGSTGTQNLMVKTTSSDNVEGDLAFNIRLNSGKVQYYLSANGSSWGIVLGGSSTNSYSTNTWQHAAVSWDGSNYRMFLNGTLERTDASSTEVFNGGYQQIYIGGAAGSTSWFSGYIDELRVSQTARYTASFTAPTTAFTNDSDTIALFHFDGADGATTDRDDNGVRQRVPITFVNNTQIDTDQSQFGGSSVKLDGTDDYFVVPDTNSGDFSGDFTWEFFFRFNSGTGGTLFDARGIDTNFTGANGTKALGDVLLVRRNSGNLQVYVDGSDRASGTVSISNGTWYHIAIQRSGNQVDVWYNGNQVVDYNQGTKDDYTIDHAIPFGVTANANASGLFNDMDGHIDEMRFSDVARYTADAATITVPTAAFTNDANTTMLLHFDGSDGATTTSDDNS